MRYDNEERQEPSRLFDGHDPEFDPPPLLTAARVKARLFLEFVERQDDGASPSLPVVRDYNGLRNLILEVSPKLAVALPPEISIASSSDDDPDDHLVTVTYGEIHFFCQQIANFLQ